MGNNLLSTSTTNIMNGLDYAWNDGEAVLWVIAQLNATDFSTEITFSALPATRSGNQKLLKFNSV